MQIDLFTEAEITTSRPAFAKQVLPAATGGEKALQEWRKAHPLKFHVLRVDKGTIYHINSVFEGYNDESYPISNFENRMKKYTVCDDLETFKSTVESPKLIGSQKQYILTKIDWKIIKELYAIVT